MNWKKIKKIDSHVHITYRKMIGSDIRYNPPKRCLEVMKEHNVEKAIVVPINFLWYHAKMSMGEDGLTCLKYNNDIQAKIAKESKRFVCFADVNFYKTDPKLVMQELERAIFELKLKGLKIHSRNNGLKGNEKVYIDLMRFAKKHDIPVLIHSFPLKGYNTVWSAPRYFAELLQKVKHRRVLLSHLGGKDWRVLKKIDCFFDFSIAMSELWNELGPQGLERAIRQIGTSRCCFGSDYKCAEYSTYYRFLNKMSFSEEEIEGISRENVLRFLN